MATINSKKADPKNYTLAGQFKLQRMLEKAERRGVPKNRTGKQCIFNAKYSCAPKACPPLAPPDTLKECSQVVQKAKPSKIPCVIDRRLTCNPNLCPPERAKKKCVA